MTESATVTLAAPPVPWFATIPARLWCALGRVGRRDHLHTVKQFGVWQRSRRSRYDRSNRGFVAGNRIRLLSRTEDRADRAQDSPHFAP